MADDLSEVELVDLELTRFNQHYYRNHYRRGVKLLLLMIAASALLISLIFYLVVTKPKDPNAFYASNTYNGRIEQVYPLSEPMLKPEKLLNWSGQTVIAAFNFNFVNYREIFGQLQGFFTAKGWQSFNDTLESSGILNTVTSKNLFASASLQGNPSILNDGVIKGHYAWSIQVPIVITYKASDSTGNTTQQMQQKLMVNIIIVRVPTDGNSDNIAIDNFSAS